VGADSGVHTMAQGPGPPKAPLRPPRAESSSKSTTTQPHTTTDPTGTIRSTSASPSRIARSSTISVGRRAGQLIVGRLQAHGRAPYQFRPNEDPSYYAKILTNSGARIVWGKDLERAIEAGETQPKAGDVVGARRTAREAVTLTDRRRDADGRVVTQTEHHVHRTRWEVEKLQFFSERVKRARLAREAQIDARDEARKHPELRSAFLSLRAAEELASSRIANPEDREKFLSMVREAMDSSIKRGEPLPDIGLRKKPSPDARQSVVPRSKRRDEPTR
jgi:hypothetical protein